MRRAHVKTTRWLAAILALCLGFAFGNAFATSEGTTDSPHDWQRNQGNVVLITVDTLRADHVGCYGYRRTNTPAINSLAFDGILFKQAVAQVPLTLPSHCSILTGDYPTLTGVLDNAGFSVKQGQETLATLLKAVGYETAAFVGSSILNARSGIAKGFDIYSDMENTNEPARRGDRVVEEAVHWIETRRHERFLVWIHLFDCHAPYSLPEPYKSQYKDHPYDGEINFVDSQVGKVVQTLRDAGLYDNTMVVFTSDHGEGLGEHGENAHGLFLYDTTLHIPLIIKGFRSQWKSRVVTRQVRSVDIAPTILQFLPLPRGTQMQGMGLQSLIEGKSNQPNLVAYSQSFYPYFHFGWSPLNSIRTDRYKYIDAPRPELYDLVSDPHEKRNIEKSNQAVATEMKEDLAREFAKFSQDPSRNAIPGPEQISSLAAEQLRSLGYASFSAGRRMGSTGVKLADPKDKIQLYALIEDAFNDSEQGRTRASTAKLIRVLNLDPGLIDAEVNFGINYAQEGKYLLAVGALTKALEGNGRNVFAIYNLAICNARLGKLEEAATGLKKALDMDPGDIRSGIALGKVYENEGNIGAAIEEFKKVVALDPNFAESHYLLSQAYDSQGWTHLAEDERLKAEQLDRRK